jgi:hypothetical protein
MVDSAGSRLKKIMRNFYFLYALFLYILFAFLFSSCQTAPAGASGAQHFDYQKKMEDALEKTKLPAGADCYFFIKGDSFKNAAVKIIPPVYIKNTHINAFIKKTDLAFAAIFTSEGEEDVFAVLNGCGYPAFFANIFFSFNRFWEKKKEAGETYWRSGRYGASLKISPKKLIAAKKSLYGREMTAGVPAGFALWSSGAAAAGWLGEAAVLNKALKKQKIPFNFPAKSVFFGLFPQTRVFENEAGAGAGEALYRIAVNIQAESQARAASLQALHNIAKKAFLEGAFNEADINGVVKIILLAASRTEGENLILESEYISEDVLFKMLTENFKKTLGL